MLRDVSRVVYRKKLALYSTLTHFHSAKQSKADTIYKATIHPTWHSAPQLEFQIMVKEGEIEEWGSKKVRVQSHLSRHSRGSHLKTCDSRPDSKNRLNDHCSVYLPKKGFERDWIESRHVGTLRDFDDTGETASHSDLVFDCVIFGIAVWTTQVSTRQTAFEMFFE